MKRNKKRLMIALLAICALAAGGAAFTASISGQLDGTHPITAGFGSQTITGANASNVHYNLSADGQYVHNVVVTLAGHDYHTGYTFTSSFVGDSTATAGVCTPVYSSPDTTLTCDFTAANSGSGVKVAEATEYDLSVTDANSTP